jgi:hypothetical protein
MAKLTLNNATTLQNIITAVNSNNDLIEAAVENTLSRNGSAPNTMSNNLDMNGNRILNLPEPSSDLEPVRRLDLTGGGLGFTTFPLSSFIQTLADDTSAAQARGTLAAAPITPDYLVGASNAELTAERVVTDTATAIWDLSTSGQAKINVDQGHLNYLIGGDFSMNPWQRNYLYRPSGCEYIHC